MLNYMQSDRAISQEPSNLLSNHGFKKSYGSYEELAADKEVDIIYIASPHSHHLEHTMICLKNKKAVICEKAFGLNSMEVEEMISEAETESISYGSTLASFPANLPKDKRDTKRR